MTLLMPILLGAAIVFSLTAVAVKTLLERGKSGWAIGVLVVGLGIEVGFIKNFLSALETATQIQ
jgi:hypothetical protein